jgi:hypothetical protein
MNEFFGEGCLAGQARRIASVATVTESVIVRLEKAAILRVIHQEPAFAEMFIAYLLGRTIRVEADLVDQLFNSSEKRLARLLLLLANFGKEDKPEPMIAKISQETLACDAKGQSLARSISRSGSRANRALLSPCVLSPSRSRRRQPRRRGEKRGGRRQKADIKSQKGRSSPRNGSSS